MNLDIFQAGNGTLLLGVEVSIDQRAYPRVDYYKDFSGAGLRRLLDHPLDGGSIDNWQHGFGKCARGRTHAGSATGGGYDGYFNIHGVTTTSV